jgi:polysaccharide export outer membrane protein
MSKTFRGVILLTVLLSLSGCLSRKKIVYFQDLKEKEKKGTAASGADTTRPKAASDTTKSTDDLLTIQPFDVLDIRVTPTIDALKGLTQSTATVISGGIGGAGGGAAATSGYYSSFLVDNNGNVTLPLIGDMNFRGLTIKEARARLKEKMKAYLLDPFVDIKFLTFRVTILGEVSRPGEYVVSNEKANIINVIAMAGDLTDNGDRRKVMVLRGDLKNPYTYNVNLTDSKSFQTPGFKLKPNDVIYIEPIKRKFFVSNLGLSLSFITLFNTMVVLYTAYRLNSR